MSGDDTARAIGIVLMLVLVGSSLIARRLPLAQTAKMSLAWVAIFAFGILAYGFRDEARGLWSRFSEAWSPETARLSGETLRIPMSDDGHFWVRATVNGSEARFLIDSGATTTALSSATIDAAGIEVDRDAMPTLIETANGTIRAHRLRVDRLDVGGIEQRDVAAVTADAFGTTNVLGMSFLSKLSRWGVDGRTLILTP